MKIAQWRKTRIELDQGLCDLSALEALFECTINRSL